MDFTFYTSGNCTTGASASGTGIALVAGVAHPSSSQGPLNTGSYSFKAHYNGDGTYLPADGPCEPLTVGSVGGIVDIRVGAAPQSAVQSGTDGGGVSAAAPESARESETEGGSVPLPALAIAAAALIAAAGALYRWRRYLG